MKGMGGWAKIWDLNQDGVRRRSPNEDERIDQDLDLNQDALRRSSGYGMRGSAKIWEDPKIDNILFPS